MRLVKYKKLYNLSENLCSDSSEPVCVKVFKIQRDMKLIKKSERLLQEAKTIEEVIEPNFQPDIINIEGQTVEEKPELDVENKEPNYIPVRDNPVTLSVGKTGWQVSDIWKDIRLDSF